MKHKKTKETLEIELLEGSGNAARALYPKEKQRKETIGLSIVMTAVGMTMILFGVGLGLLCYFLLKQGEDNTIFQAIVQQQNLARDRFLLFMDNSLRTMRTVQALFETEYSHTGSNSSKQLVVDYDRFVSFANTAGLEQNGLASVDWVPLVWLQDRFAFENEARSLAQLQPEYQNFTIYERNSTVRILPLKTRPFYYPVTYVYPFPTVGWEGVIAFDLASDTTRNVTIHKSIMTGNFAATSKTVLGRDIIPQNSVMIFMPIIERHTNTVKGVVRGTYRIQDILRAAMHQVCHYTLFDESQTTGDNFLATTDTAADAAKTKAEFLKMDLKSTVTLTVADRQWSLWVTPNAAFIRNNSSHAYEKWLGLFLSMGALCAAFALLAATVSRIFHQRKINMLHKAQLILETHSKNKLSQLIHKILDEEKKVRTVMNAIPYSVCTVAGKHSELTAGTVIQGNAAFLSMTGFAKHDVDTGVITLGKLLPQFSQVEDLDKYCDEDQNSSSDESGGSRGSQDGAKGAGDLRMMTQTKMVNKFGTELKVMLTANKFSMAGSGPSADENTANVTTLNTIYIIILYNKKHLQKEKKKHKARNALLEEEEQNQGKRESTSLAHVSPLSPSAATTTRGSHHPVVDERSAFADMIAHPEGHLRQEFKAYCKQEKSLEGILFIEAVEQYKHIPEIEKRVIKQDWIINTFLTSGVSLELNVSKSVISQDMYYISKGLGQVDVFDNLVEVVKQHLKTDTFPRFYKSKH